MSGFFVLRNELPGREGYFQRQPADTTEEHRWTLAAAGWRITERLEDAEPFHSLQDLLWEVQGIGQLNPTWRFRMTVVEITPWR